MTCNCTMHFIKTSTVEKLVLTAIREVSAYVREDEFIEKVVVHEADKSTGDRRQKVDIYFNFIGCFVPPKPEVILTAEEEAKTQKALAAGTGSGSKTSYVCAG